MKRISAILSVCLLVIMLSAVSGFAGNLQVDLSNPKDGDTGMAKDNLGVKLYFNQDMYSKKYNKANEKCFSITDEKGKEIPIIVVFNSKKGYENQVLVLEDTNSKYKVEQEMTYTLHIDEKLVSATGDTLSDKALTESDISFTTVNQSKTNMINMLMMVAMIVVMIFFTIRGSKKEAEKNPKKEEKVNPYKEAKRTGKSVEEIVAKDEKAKAKRAAKEAKIAEEEAREREAEEARAAEEEARLAAAGRKRVSRPRPISEGGSAYVTGRKALAEKKAAEEEARRAAGTTNPKHKGKKKK